jgi:hypothetical protein
MSEVLESVSTDEQVMDDLQMLGHKVEHSMQLLQGGVADSLATALKEFRANPEGTMFKILVQSEAEIKNNCETVLVLWLKSQRDKIAAAYRRKRNDRVIEFIVALTEDSLDVKFDINEFVLTYMQTHLQARFPMVLHYVKVEDIVGLQNVESVNLVK